MCYEWQEIPTTFIDIKKREYQVTARKLVAIDDKHPDGIPTGLCYIQAYPPMYYFFNEPMIIGYYGSYYPLHLRSHEKLYGACWSNERTIQSFLQLLFEASPVPDYWCAEDRVACIDQFPGGFAKIVDLTDQSVQLEGERKTPQVIQLICKLIFGEDGLRKVPPKQTKLEPEELALIREAGAEEGTHECLRFLRSYYWYVIGETFYCEIERRPGDYLKLFQAVRKKKANQRLRVNCKREM